MTDTPPTKTVGPAEHKRLVGEQRKISEIRRLIGAYEPKFGSSSRSILAESRSMVIPIPDGEWIEPLTGVIGSFKKCW